MLNNFNYEEDVKKPQNESVVSQLLGELLPKKRQEEVLPRIRKIYNCALLVRRQNSVAALEKSVAVPEVTQQKCHVAQQFHFQVYTQILKNFLLFVF